jgi:hypothetical protein
MRRNIFFRPLGLFLLMAGMLVAGCGDSSDDHGEVGDTIGDTDSSCASLQTPCSDINLAFQAKGTVAECVLDHTTCVFDLQNVLDQVGIPEIDMTSAMLIQAWGGQGGYSATDKGGYGATSGYAQTTTSVDDIAGINNSSTQIFYFLGGEGQNGPDHCGGSGGAATIVSLQDLSLTPSENPTQSAPPILLIAAGGGGASAGGGWTGCPDVPKGSDGCAGGVAIALQNANASGAGSGGIGLLCGGGGNNGVGGAGVETAGNGSGNYPPVKGWDGFGAIGGTGGNGDNCDGQLGKTGFINTAAVTFSFPAGEGGYAGGGINDCDAGGGGGGGGHGNEGSIVGGGLPAIAGGGGGSFAIESTLESQLAPSSRPAPPSTCNNIDAGCVRLGFVFPPQPRWVAVGVYGGDPLNAAWLAVSNGKNWGAAATSPDDSATDVATDGAGNWVAVGSVDQSQTGRAWFSNDNGVHWTVATQSPPGIATSVATDGGGNWVSVGESTVYSSDNGKTWVAATGGIPLGVVPIGVATDRNKNWIAVGADGAWHSGNNGDTWTSITALASINATSVASDGGQSWAIVGDGVAWYSTDGAQTWTSSEMPPNAKALSVATDGNGTWVAVGGNSSFRGPGNAWWSTDGGNIWASADPAPSFQALGVATDGKGNWVAVGGPGLAGAVWYSNDQGSTWTSAPNAPSPNLTAVAVSDFTP